MSMNSIPDYFSFRQMKKVVGNGTISLVGELFSLIGYVIMLESTE